MVRDQREYHKQWRLEHPGYDKNRPDKAKRAERKKELYKLYPEKFKKWWRASYMRRRDKIIAKALEYQRLNPHIPRATQARRRAAEGSWNSRDLARLYWFQD